MSAVLNVIDVLVSILGLSMVVGYGLRLGWRAGEAVWPSRLPFVVEVKSRVIVERREGENE